LVGTVAQISFVHTIQLHAIHRLQPSHMFQLQIANIRQRSIQRNNYPAFYGTLRFITAFTSARHLSLSRARSIQSIPPHPTSKTSILKLSSYLRQGLPSGLFPSGFPTKTLYKPLLAPIFATCPAHLILDLFPE